MGLLKARYTYTYQVGLLGYFLKKIDAHSHKAVGENFEPKDLYTLAVKTGVTFDTRFQGRDHGHRKLRPFLRLICTEL